MTDYNFRGITQSAHKPSVAGYFEPRYNINPNLQLYAGMSGESIDFPNRAAAEIDFYGGIRPTFDKLALDFGVLVLLLPGWHMLQANVRQLPANGCLRQTCRTATSSRPIVSFWEVYGKATYTFNDNSPSASAPTIRRSCSIPVPAAGTPRATSKFTAPGSWFAKDWGGYASGDRRLLEARYQRLLLWRSCGASPAAFRTRATGTGTLGVGLTYKVFTLDLRYYGTNLNSGDCNAFTSDHTATRGRETRDQSRRLPAPIGAAPPTSPSSRSIRRSTLSSKTSDDAELRAVADGLPPAAFLRAPAVPIPPPAPA